MKVGNARPLYTEGIDRPQMGITTDKVSGALCSGEVCYEVTMPCLDVDMQSNARVKQRASVIVHENQRILLQRSDNEVTRFGESPVFYRHRSQL